MKRSRLRPVSDKRRDDNALRAEMMEAKYGPRPWRCLAERALLGQMGPCHGEVNGHEIIKASQWRAGRLVPDNVVTLCNFHNGWVEDNPIEAHELGLMKHSWERDED